MSWILNDIGRNSLLGNGKKIAKFLKRTFTCRSTFLYDHISHNNGPIQKVFLQTLIFMPKTLQSSEPLHAKMNPTSCFFGSRFAYLLAGALLFDEKIRQCAALFWFGLRYVGAVSGSGGSQKKFQDKQQARNSFRNSCRRFNSTAGCPTKGPSCKVGTGNRKFRLYCSIFA
jgi:hypothetical protein